MINVLALDGAFNGANIKISDMTQENDTVVIGQGDEAETYRLERWTASSDELVLMTYGGRREPEIMVELGLSA